MRMTFIALSMIILATPGAAAESTASQGAGAEHASSAIAKEKKYCVRLEEMTGTRTPVLECRTKADWARDGVTVETKPKS